MIFIFIRFFLIKLAVKEKLEFINKDNYEYDNNYFKIGFQWLIREQTLKTDAAAKLLTAKTLGEIQQMIHQMDTWSYDFPICGEIKL